MTKLLLGARALCIALSEEKSADHFMSMPAGIWYSNGPNDPLNRLGLAVAMLPFTAGPNSMNS